MKRSVLSFSHDLNKSRSEVRDPQTLVDTVQQVSDNLAELLNNPDVEYMRLAAVFAEVSGDVRVVEIKRNREDLSGSIEVYETTKNNSECVQNLQEVEQGLNTALQDYRYMLDENFGNELKKISEANDGVNGYHESYYRRD